MKPAFSTVAFPTWPLDRLAQTAETWGYQGIELRTLGNASSALACDPALSSAGKARTLLRRAGLEPVVLATGIRYDEPVFPPLLGYVFSDHERSIRQTKGMVDLALALECPFVRVFAFEIPGSERRESALARICGRLSLACAYARNSGVKLLIENGGSFNKASDLAEIIDRVNSPLLHASYSAAVASADGENPADGITALGDRLAVLKVRDFVAGRPCALGTGEIDNRSAVLAAAKAGFRGWVVYEHDTMWLPSGNAEDAVARSARTLYEWMGPSASAIRRAPAKV